MRVASLTSRPVVMTILGALTIAFSAILVRVSHAEPATAAVFRCLYAAPVLVLLARRETRAHGSPRAGRDRRLGAVAGVLFAVDLLCWHQAIRDVGAGLATVLGNLQVVLVGPVAFVVLRERPDRRLAYAVPVVLLGVILISGALGSSAYGNDPARGAVFGVLTGISYAAFILVLRQASRGGERSVGALADATVVAAFAAAAVGLALGAVDLVPSWPAHGWLLVLALSSQVLGWLLIAGGMSRIPAALGSVLITIQPVGSVFLGVILLGERPSAVQFAGVALVLAGVIGASGLGAALRRRPRPSGASRTSGAPSGREAAAPGRNP